MEERKLGVVTRAPIWKDLDKESPYQYLESLTGANVKKLRFTVRIKGVPDWLYHF